MATFGYNTIGGSTAGIFTDQTYFTCKFSAPEDGDITKIYVHARCQFASPTDPFHVAIYSDSGGNPNTLLASSASPGSVGTTFAWVSADINYTMTSGQDLHLAVWVNGAYELAYDAGATNQTGEKDNQTYNSWETPLNTGVDFLQFASVLSIYAEYTPAATTPVVLAWVTA